MERNRSDNEMFTTKLMRKPVIALLARDLPTDISLIIGNSHIFACVYLNYTHRHETCQASIAVSIRMVKVDFGFNNLETCSDALIVL